MLDLQNIKYDYHTLKENIYDINLLDILKTQYITADFALKYILNKNYQLSREEEQITVIDVLKYQPHLLKTNLLVDYKYGIKKIDSFEDFETFSNRNRNKNKNKNKN